MSQTLQLAELRHRRAKLASIMLGTSLVVSNCCGVGNCRRLALIGEETARGTTTIEGRTFGYVYRAVGIPMMGASEMQKADKNIPKMVRALYDEGVPLIEISSTNGILREGDEVIARQAALALCEQNTSWRRDTLEAERRNLGGNGDFYENGVWSFVMVCK